MYNKHISMCSKFRLLNLKQKINHQMKDVALLSQCFKIALILENALSTTPKCPPIYLICQLIDCS